MLLDPIQVLRASEALPQGAEVTVSYLGQLVAAPVEVRREELRMKYGFTCGCSRWGWANPQPQTWPLDPQRYVRPHLQMQQEGCVDSAP